MSLGGLCSALPPSSSPAPAVVIFGGGWSPEGNQASLERNVSALAELLRSRHPQILFAAGDPHARSVQVLARERDETSELLGMIFDRRDGLDVTYRRPHTSFDGSANRANLLAALERSAQHESGTIAFGVGHGSPEGDGQRVQLDLWGPDDGLTVDGLATYLDHHPRRGMLALVLGQCHSGGFTELLNRGADPKAKVAQPVRCVFAAVPSSREAAGCTADADDPEARAYLGAFAEGLALPSADADHDGHVSLAEAHAHALAADDTVDTPVSTSELWLRHLLGEKAVRAETRTYAEVLKLARPAEKAALAALNPYPAEKETLRNAGAHLVDLDTEINALQKKSEAAQARFDRSRRALRAEVLLQFPELANPYHPEARRLLAGAAKEIVDYLRANKSLNELIKQDDAVGDLEEQKFELEKEAARLERFLDLSERVANAALVRQHGRRADIETLDAIEACEDLAPL